MLQENTISHQKRPKSKYAWKKLPPGSFFSDDVSLAALTTFRHHPNICKLQINIQFSKHWILSKFYSMLRVWGFMEVELVLAGYSCWKSLLAGNNFYSGGPSGRGGDPRWEIATNRFCTCTCTYIHVHCTYICYYLDFTYISSHITCTIYMSRLPKIWNICVFFCKN